MMKLLIINITQHTTNKKVNDTITHMTLNTLNGITLLTYHSLFNTYMFMNQYETIMCMKQFVSFESHWSFIALLRAGLDLELGLNRFTHESNEWSQDTFLLMALGAHLHTTWDILAFVRQWPWPQILTCPQLYEVAPYAWEFGGYNFPIIWGYLTLSCQMSSLLVFVG